ncbi:MAG: nucleoside triphosphate pyrophosphatase [Gammaproteobacteria bacterium]
MRQKIAAFVHPVEFDSLQDKIILASSSPYRKQLLERLHLEFECRSPDIDESVENGESAIDYVRRLARDKALTIARSNPEAVVIGSDQCALLDARILGKPGSHENALRQLCDARGKTVVFHTALCVIRLRDEFCELEEVPFEVDFRNLSDAQLEHYLRVEQPYQCAGGFKAEGYGACLFSALRGDDPSALIGLPLLTLTPMLERAGIEVV